MTRNLLENETSPYLLQHKDNPVHWRPWGQQALSDAVSQDRPILLSIGYAACHWCHVMAHESFESDAIAGVMNDLFINIKVDREERPDLDAIYQSALNVLGEQGGWPLTMFLKPDGSPFWGGTYFPPESRYGRPGFPDVLTQISDIFATKKDQIDQNATAIGDALKQIGATSPDGSVSMVDIDRVSVDALQLIDFHLGGTSGAPKFPQPTFFKFLWSGYLRTREQRQFEAVAITLNNMCQGGIYDHLAGGFSRYSVDDYWLAPHFEKMLYDNALLVDLMCDVWQETRMDLYETRIRETVSWMLSDLRNAADDGRFALASAYDADSEGEEGKYYVWSQGEINTHLGNQAAEFSRAYDVSPAGNWEGNTILRRRVDDLDQDPERAARLAASREALLNHRVTRIPPQRDDKVLADWNGMAVTALVRAGGLFDETAWIDHAKTIYAFVKTHMSMGDRLHHTWCAGKSRHPAVIDDYANMGRAALALHQVTQDESYLEDAQTWVGVADRHYWDHDNGAYFLAADDTDDLIIRTKTLFDNAVPSGNGVMLDVLARLYHITGRPAYRDKAHALATAMAPQDSRGLMNQPSLALGFEVLDQGLQIVVVAPERGDSGAHDLFVLAQKTAPSHAIVSWYVAGHPLPNGHPAAGKGVVDGQAAAYICSGPVCGLPVTSPGDLIAALASD